MYLNLVCPKCHNKLVEKEELLSCVHCLMSYKKVLGCIDFVSCDSNKKDKIYYDDYYNNINNNFKNTSIQSLGMEWTDKLFPSGNDILSLINDVEGKTMICLGNGVSIKEVFFASNGACLFLSDISLNAMIISKNYIEKNYNKNNIKFLSIDAYQLPFDDNSVDIVYGFGFVHHLQDKESFLKETYRVLKTSGICIFFDDAMSPFWHFLKTTILKPLMIYSHNKRGISPEDLRATYEDGFTKKEIMSLGSRIGFNDNIIFIKRELLLYIWLRGMGKVFNIERNNSFIRGVGHILSLIDNLMGSVSKFYRNNMIRVVWGYIK